LLLAGVNVARMLIDRGDLVLIADSQGIRDIYSADGNSIDNSTPLVVLVNKGTASASEVRQYGRHNRLLRMVGKPQLLSSWMNSFDGWNIPSAAGTG
jgi:C-terminal processing protease CtpA/Prc